MTTLEALDQAAQLLMAEPEAISRPALDRLDLRVSVDELLAKVALLHEARWGYLSAITGVDEGDNLAVLYHFCARAAILTLRLSIPREQPTLPSICGLIPSAVLQERELHEMFGLEVRGLPDASRLFLAETWPEGIYPLRKDANFDLGLALGGENGQ